MPGQTENQRFKQMGWWVFWALPILYFLLYASLGFSTKDPAFIPALSHRILLGEHPGLDFIYVRPPLTPYLHALEMSILPQDGQIFWMRLVYYLMMALSVFWGVKSLSRFGNLENWGIPAGWLAVLALILSYHNYPAMPWHTVDGIFFTTAGLFVLTRRHHVLNVAIGLILMGLAALTKQPFALVPLTGICLTFIIHPFTQAWKGLAIAVASGIATLVCILLLPSGADFLKANWTFISGSSGGKDLWQAGIISYKPAVVFGAPYLLLFVGGRIFKRFPYTGLIMFAAVMAGILFWLGVIAVLVHQEQRFLPPRYGFYHLLLLISLATVVGLFFKLDLRKMMAVLGFLGLASWASGISWGYAFPAQLALPGIAGTLIFASFVNGFILPKWTLPVLSAAAFISFYFAQAYPYGEKHRSLLTYHAGDIYPELHHIYTDKNQFQKLKDFKELQERTGENFAVLPGFPIADYVSHTKPVLQLDWEHDGEMAHEKGIPKVIARLEEKRPTVFVEKDMKSEAYSPNRNYRCAILAYVLDAWEKTDSTEYFDAYKKPEPLPFIYFQF